MPNQKPFAGEPVTDTAPNLVPGRSCADCTLCCMLYPVPALTKPANVWCVHCDVSAGCRNHEHRPQMCRDFFCHYRLDADVPEHWKPNRSHMVMVSDASGARIIIDVDPAHPEAWREAPYYQDLKAWSANRLRAEKQVHVRSGGRIVVILPDRDVDLGEVGDRMIVTNKTWTPNGPLLDFELIARDSPQALALQRRAAEPPNPFRW
ncbi:MAG TPA: hypothetical protein VNU97_13225 [Rhizomicrobium sp.]|jgi:hypothetical protein|nr:hypothetical protein [Rhizomicrobium sp.]